MLVYDDGVKSVTLMCNVIFSPFSSKPEYDFYALINQKGETRAIFPERLTEKQKQMSTKEYVFGGRCEFFKYVRPANMFRWILDYEGKSK